MGNSNSSITRVRPFFQALFAQPEAAWLPKLLSLGSNTALSQELAASSGTILPTLLLHRDYPDRVLQEYGIPSIALESCFETKVAPPTRFLRWLIENPERLNDAATKGEFSALRRSHLKGADVELRRSAMAEAIRELERSGRRRSIRKWWAFEGFTDVDCFIETESLILFIEGKRTDVLAERTLWYDGRNQLIRNIEVAQEEATSRSPSKTFAVLVMSEEFVEPMPQAVIDASLPHLSTAERHSLMSHYLGCVTWKDACVRLNVDYTSLPKSVEDHVKSLKHTPSE